MSEIELENKFKKFRLEEEALNAKEESPKCNCSTNAQNLIILKPSLLEISYSKLKTKERRSSCLIKPARLKVIGNCYAKKLKCNNGNIKNSSSSNRSSKNSEKTCEDFTSEAFHKMRISTTISLTITPAALSRSDSPSHNPVESPIEQIDKDDRLPSTSSSSLSHIKSCSTQAKLQQQISTTEFDSTIDEMSDFLAYHLTMFNHRDKYLIDSMYT
jgi:hypothetical protein